MPNQYHAHDSATGLDVTVTGEFPADPDDRVRIARTANLFTRLMSTILSTANDYERRERFRAIETQLGMADALIRGDIAEVHQLMRSTLTAMGMSDDQFKAAREQFRQQLEAIGGDPSAIEMLFGSADSQATETGPLDDVVMDDITLADLPRSEAPPPEGACDDRGNDDPPLGPGRPDESDREG